MGQETHHQFMSLLIPETSFIMCMASKWLTSTLLLTVMGISEIHTLPDYFINIVIVSVLNCSRRPRFPVPAIISMLQLMDLSHLYKTRLVIYIPAGTQRTVNVEWWINLVTMLF